MRRSKGRVVGLDVHPDSFAAAVVEGSDSASARVLSSSTRVELKGMEQWALRHSGQGDVLVMEASGNAFVVAKRLRVLGRNVEILDSHRAGKVGKVYCANDRINAVKIARIYLSGLSPIVWQPDGQTLERREVFSAYQAVVKEATKGQAAAARHAQRTLCAPGERLPLESPRSDHAPAQAAGMDPGAGAFAQATPRWTGGRPRPPHYATPPHGQRDRGRRRLAAGLTRLCGLSRITLSGLVASTGVVRRFRPTTTRVRYLGSNTTG